LSSILKALKKLEEESLHHKMIYPGSSGRGKDIMVNRSRFALTWPYKVFITLCFLTAFLVIARWVTLSNAPVLVQQDHEKSVLPQQVKPIKPVAPEKVQSALEAPSNTIAEDLFTEKNPAQATSDKSQQMDNENSDLLSTFSQQTPLVSPSAPSTAFEVKEASPISLSSIEEYSDDTRLKLQAIAWSSNPEKRMAMINNQIVREGSSIQGISVIHILENQVIFREGEATFKITFGLK